MYVAGMDPGQKGALAALSATGELAVLPMPLLGKEPCVRSVKEFLLRFEIKHVFIEHSQAIPGKVSSSASFRFGMGFGILIGVVAGMSLPYTLVKPRIWQGVMFKGTDADLSPKERSFVAAIRHFPTERFLASERCKKPHDGMTDASLIAGYGLRSLGVSSATLSD